MFGDIQKQLEEVKKQLDDVIVETSVENGLVTVKANGNKKITNISIDPSLVASKDIEELEDLLLLAVNRAMDKAEEASETHMQGAAQSMLGGLGGMFGGE